MSFELIDTHCHVHFEAYKEDMDEVVTRALERGIGMITVGTQTTTSKNAVELARKHDGVWATIGLHPNHLHQQEFFDENELAADEEMMKSIKTRAEAFDDSFYRELVDDPNVVAIGEFGLDFYRIPENESREKVIEDQKASERQQLAFASSVGKPVVIHCRNAHEDQYNLLKEEIDRGGLKQRGVIHCFTGTVEEARRYHELGFHTSITGIVNFSKELQAVVKELPLENIMIETDAPYLTPPPHRGKRNEPAYVRFIAEHIAELKGVSYDEVASVTTSNARQLFNIE